MKSLPRAIEKKLTGREWYHQRFDGAPMYIGFVPVAELRREQRIPAGAEADIRACFFLDKKADWYLDMADVRRGASAILRLARRNPKISQKLLRSWRDDEKHFELFFERFDKRGLRQNSDQELLVLYRQFFSSYLKRFTSSAIIDHFALGTDEYIANLLRTEVGRLRKESDFTGIFSIATAPVHQSFINEAEMELLKIARRWPESRPELAQHQTKYFWSKNNYYSSHVLSFKYFEREIKELLKYRRTLRAKYLRLKTTPVVNQRRKAQLFRKYNFSRYLRTLLKISEDFTWWQDERKKSTYQAIHLGTRILGEMAHRRSYPLELMKYLIPSEVAGMFAYGSPSPTALKKRQRGCFFVWTRQNQLVFTGQDVAVLRKVMFGKKAKQDTVQDVRGLSASVGRAIGRVKVVGSVNEIGKVQKGDILIAVMTRPDYIAGIKKAAAIVTNEGGITCHAAIVSRELGIPCIISTKIATEVFHDGDLVEVNANHGVVTLLKSTSGDETH